MQISIPRLRQFIDDAAAAHAALLSVAERQRHARRTLSTAREALVTFEESRPQSHPGRTLESYRAPLMQAVTDAQIAVEAAEAAYDAASDKWRHARILADAARDFARDNGVLPADLEAA